ncbi:hypothetical protein [Cardinium endosymbiont of Philonthus spinipes]|uniref:hypothetical protein n=1 Tax=Cardinium endosymbiont of Philonthus spinipes TaxID=3077941 RepID=UPI00313C475D
MITNQLIALLYFYIIGLTGCNQIGKRNCVRDDDKCRDDIIACFNKLDKLVDPIINQSSEEIKVQTPATKPISTKTGKNSKTKGKTPADRSTGTKNAKNSKIDDNIALKILIKIQEDSSLADVRISNELYHESGKAISDNTIRGFLQAKKLNNKRKRDNAIKYGRLKQMIKELETRLGRL